MNDATARRLAQVLKFNGTSVIEDRASLLRLLAPGLTEIPADVGALMMMLDTKAVAHLVKWSRTEPSSRPAYAQMRDHIAAKYEQAGKLPAATAAWALDAWRNALPELQRAAAEPVRDLALEALPPPPAEPAPRLVGPGSHSSGAAPSTQANPYAPPQAHVEDVVEIQPEPDFIENGRSVSIGRGLHWFAEGWRLFARQPLMWWLCLIVFVLVSVAIQFIPLFIGAIIGFLLGPVLWSGLMSGAHAVKQGDSLTIGHVFAGFKDRTGSLILVAILQLIGFVAAGAVLWFLFGSSLVAIGMLAAQAKAPTFAMINSMLGLVVVWLALFIPLGVVYYLAPALVAINGCNPVTAVKSAFVVCFKNILPGIVYLIVFTLAAIVATIPIGLGWLVLAPMVVTSVYAAYRDIFYSDPADAPPSTRPAAAASRRLARTLTPAANVPAAPAPAAR